jgi:hypothetical protein
VAALEHISKHIGYDNLFVERHPDGQQEPEARFVEKIGEKLGRPIDGAKIARVGAGIQGRHRRHPRERRRWTSFAT